MIWLSLAVGLPMVVMMSWAVGVAIKTDEQIGQARQIAGKRVIINREGCSEAASLCAYEAVAGGVGGGDCKEFYRLTGKTVWDYCKDEFKAGR